MSRTVIGLGSNLGDRLQTLRDAARKIAEVAPIEKYSSIYETEPVGGPSQADFLNAAVLVDWPRDPHVLLDALQRIELELGRVRDPSVRWGPRTIDLDLLWREGAPVHSERLTIPHPRLYDRAFALVPLLELVPWLEAALTEVPAEDGLVKTEHALSGA